jgi:hypothetical protein
MLMLTGYYDRGGEGGEDGMTVVAGYVSSVEHWAGFDAAWRAYLAARVRRALLSHEGVRTQQKGLRRWMEPPTH